MSDRFYSIAEAAEKLGVSTKTIRRWIALGHLSARRIGPRLIRIPAASLAQLTSERHLGAA